MKAHLRERLTVLTPLPDRDFDPTEAAVIWSLIREAGHEVLIAPPNRERDPNPTR